MDAHRFLGHGLPFFCKDRQFRRITKRFLKFCRIRGDFSEVLPNKKCHHIILSVNKRCKNAHMAEVLSDKGRFF